MAVINKSLAPFTYSGSWELHDYNGGKNYYARLLTNGTLSPKRNFTCDIYAIGGGGGGGGGRWINGGNTWGGTGGGGGGGGCTLNKYNVAISSNVTATIGAGGSGGDYSYDQNTVSTAGGTGGTTKLSGGYTLSAYGGDGGAAATYSEGKGGDGGSGGGRGGYSSSTTIYPAGSGGSNGGNGSGPNSRPGGVGQGTTTRPFGVTTFGSNFGAGGRGGQEPDNGAAVTPTPGATNSGNGGQGGPGVYGNYKRGANGGSGIVIIRGILNRPPTDPDGISYGTPQAGKALVLSTGGSTDPEGDAISYVWEHRADSGVYTQVGITAETQITATVPNSGTTYQARVKAVDATGPESGYTTGEALPINYNNPPTISGQDEDLGPVTDPPTWDYTVDDVDEDQTLTISERVGDTTLRTFAATRGATYTADASPQWLYLSGDQQLTISVEDEVGGSAVRAIAFSRSSPYIEAAQAISTDHPVVKCLLSLFPETQPGPYTLVCQVCNNPFDEAPAWEDISDKVGRIVHTFANTENAEGDGIGFRFRLEPSGGGEVHFDTLYVRFA